MVPTGVGKQCLEVGTDGDGCVPRATNMGWINAPVPPVWWKLSPAADRLRNYPNRIWFPPARLQIERLARTSDAVFLGITIVALSLGLRLGEAASIRSCDIVSDACPPGIWFDAEKLPPDRQRRTFRSPPSYVMGWACFLVSAQSNLGNNLS